MFFLEVKLTHLSPCQKTISLKMEDIDSEIAIISHAFAHFTFYVVSEFEDIVNYLRIYIFQKYFTDYCSRSQ